MNSYLKHCAALLVACGCSGILMASEEELFGVVAGKLGNGGGDKVAALVDESVPPEASLPNVRVLKEISAFGLVFSGRATSSGSTFDSFGYWVKDPKLLRETAEETFKTMAGMLEKQFGAGKSAQVPNFEDASPEGTRFLWWPVQGDVVLLSIHGRSRLANLTLERRTRDAWLADMGANESEYWKTILQEAAGPVSPPVPSKDKGSTSETLSHPPAQAINIENPPVPVTPQSAGYRGPMLSDGYWLFAVFLIAVMILIFLVLRSMKTRGSGE